MQARGIVILLLGALLLLGVLAGLWMRARGSRRPEAGPAARFAPCGSRPNCVSSLSDDPARRVAPLPVSGDPAAAFAAARAAVAALPRIRVVVDEEGYLRAECRSAVFGFVDDLELRLDSERRAIDVRSASREGYSDLGVNRRRVERLRAALASNR